MTRQRRPHHLPETPAEALSALLEGNRRYREGKPEPRDYLSLGERIASEQRPIAAVLSCADSRVAPNLVFDVAHGNVFVCRIAGNVADQAVFGSLEYGIAVLGIKLILVLGHSDCGAVKSAIDMIEHGKRYPVGTYGQIGSVLEPIIPAVRSIPPNQRSVERCIAANAQHEAQRLAGLDPIIAPRVASGELAVLAAVYDIASGKISMLG